ncbi:MAG: L,D-transpeptidase family protein [Candidatus Omnitrophica bacterium]|nr:L,D-transpeptidase family protein [Candidatus Omnitrophota bacterium]MBD3269045.1 L,D-transpeptidase family protein [Candidatus Omnitrophota bacterium]
MKKVQIIIVSLIILLVGFSAFIFFSGDKEKRIPSPSSLFKEAREKLENNELLEAKDLYRKVLEESENIEQLREIQDKIETINVDILFSPRKDECTTIYEVKPNDALFKIARKFNTTVNLIKRANNLTSDIIRPGQELKINNCKFSIVVDKSQNILFLKRGDELFKTYRVSTGKNNNTPTGTFKIINKLENPTWYKTGAVIPPGSPENILGSRWMGFDTSGYGIHGTTEPQDLGKQITLGCIRMRNDEVEELYDIVPVGTEVTIVD